MLFSFLSWQARGANLLPSDEFDAMEVLQG